MSVYQPIPSTDIVATRTLLHEAIPITGSIVTASYGTWPDEENIKNYSHGMFQSVYDYPYLSSSANHIFDITLGYSSNSFASASTSVQNAKKINIYNQMAQVLAGYDQNNAIREFDEDGIYAGTTGETKIQEAVFMTFSRLLVKDEIQKGTFELELGVRRNYRGANNSRIKIKDVSADSTFKVNSPTGEYGILIASNSVGSNVLNNQVGTLAAGQKVGLIYYQAGVVVLSSSIFNDVALGGVLKNSEGALSMHSQSNGHVYATPAEGQTINSLLTGSQISASADALRRRIYNVSFNNTIELNSTIYFCRASHNMFNFSGNPTYLNGSQIRTKASVDDVPVSYITTIGLYSPDNTLMAVGKLSEPIRKDPNIELTFRARLDY